MIFTAPIFFYFFAICFIVYWTLKRRKHRHIFLFLASYIFYGWWDWRFLLLISLVVLIAFMVPILKNKNPDNKVYVPFGILFSLGILGVFKYAGFFTVSFVLAFQSIGASVSKPMINIILPVGISFFTFQAISYIVDAAKGTIPLEKSLLRVGLYISFFPQLVAGPIVRASDFMPQLHEDKYLTRVDMMEGGRAFVMGFLYKAIFADSLAPFVDKIYASPKAFSAHAQVMGTLGFYGQIYFDFAGYSLMAIGISRLLGLVIPPLFSGFYKWNFLYAFSRRFYDEKK